jgi:chromosome segregation ATPase
MEETRLNLERVADIIGEVDGQLKSLRRQAKKAERYKGSATRCITTFAEVESIEKNEAAELLRETAIARRAQEGVGRSRADALQPGPQKRL